MQSGGQILNSLSNVRKKKRISCAILIMKSRCLDSVIEYMIALSTTDRIWLSKDVGFIGCKAVMPGKACPELKVGLIIRIRQG